MKVSVITATYNSAKSIESCLFSVLNQNYNNIEYVIIDGKSNDQTLTILNKFAAEYNQIRISSEKDSGLYDALNKGDAT